MVGNNWKKRPRPEGKKRIGGQGETRVTTTVAGEVFVRKGRKVCSFARNILKKKKRMRGGGYVKKEMQRGVSSG